MEKIITKRKNGTLRVQHKVLGPSLTDQSDKNMVDINNIMSNYSKTGLLPQFKEKVAQYIDATQIPSYMEAQAQISKANQLFSQLPAEVRKLMMNDPSKLEEVIQNPEYTDILIKHGVLEKKEEAQASSQSEKQAKPAAKANSSES